MEQHIEEQANGKNINGYFYLLGAVFGGLTGGYIQESFLAAIIGVVVGVAFAGFFVGSLLKGREHDR
ncbi:hypothetical protein GCM10011386_32760 [Parapedobacter defluvii]|uniref:Glycine zipper family protein n=1 Tax=Parapedobacter defluvii TaxID=2045106 RepID=A0ABQ1MC63_9SPHI|nr:hypothetical protein [Parapedobacter defluvii]RQP07489.1 MAG: hypothetical protein EAS52_26370 [Parapedobacter sp.]GGC38127.1 hypothetical protein GCM10011386_32760 [Parapedobacter defluvii]